MLIRKVACCFWGVQAGLFSLVASRVVCAGTAKKGGVVIAPGPLRCQACCSYQHHRYPSAGKARVPGTAAAVALLPSQLSGCWHVATAVCATDGWVLIMQQADVDVSRIFHMRACLDQGPATAAAALCCCWGAAAADEDFEKWCTQLFDALEAQPELLGAAAAAGGGNEILATYRVELLEGERHLVGPCSCSHCVVFVCPVLCCACTSSPMLAVGCCVVTGAFSGR